MEAMIGLFHYESGVQKRSKLVYICENHQHTDKMVLKVRGTDLMTNDKSVDIKEVQN